METPNQWDERLSQHIAHLRGKVVEDEQAGKDFMRSEGASERTIAQVTDSQRSRGSRISWDPATLSHDRAATWAEGVLQNGKQFLFRLDINEPQLGGPGLLPVRVVTERGTYWLDTSCLTQEGKRLFVKQVALLIPYNSLTRGWGGHLFEPYTFYPSPDLMNGVQWLLATHRNQDLLAEKWKIDEEAYTFLREFLVTDEYKQASQRILQQLRREQG